MEIVRLISHPEQLDKDTLYQLRELVAKYPYFQAARLLFLKNLFLLHDPSFGEELRRAALYVPDRSVLFRLVEGDNYKPQPVKKNSPETNPQEGTSPADRTQSLIDDFLRTTAPSDEEHPRRKLTVADATTDYAAFLLQMEDAAVPDETDESNQRRQVLIDDFIENKPDRIVLQAEPEYKPDIPAATDDAEEAADEDYLTETLAKIYIKQGRYEKALEIIRKLNLIYPKKNSYFADQIRFLQKLIINNKNKT